MWLSISLVIGFLMISLVRWDETFFIGYFVTGAWQVISILVHTVNRWFINKGSARSIYHWIVLLTLTLAFIPFTSIYILYALLFAAPFMAIYYTYICYREVYIKMQRPMNQLK